MKKTDPSFFIKKEFYYDSPPFYYDPEDYPWIKQVEGDWKVIREEFETFFRNGGEIEGLSSYIPAPSTGWKNFYFMNFLWIQYANCKLFPKTWNILTKVPGLVFAAIGVLEPKSKVLPHYGPTNINIRCQVGIKIPAAYPVCGIKVGEEARGWEEGKSLMFSDCSQHTAWNDSDETRIVLIFDILKKDYASQPIWMCAQYLASVSLRFIDMRVSFLQKTPELVVKCIHKISSVIWSVFLWLQLRFRFLLKKD